MSGILGILRRDGSSVEQSNLDEMMTTLAHRGPDGSATARRGPVGMGQLRLCTTPEAQHGSTRISERRHLITADARIDNRDELLEILDASDMEPPVTAIDLILAAYDKWGSDCPKHLVGAYAFVLWDGDRQRLFCARDHVGIKPFYYHDGTDIFAFASEIKALHQLDSVPRRVNDVAIGDYLLKLSGDTEQTFYEDISRLPPAHVLLVDFDGMRQRRYWELDRNRTIEFDDPDEYVREFRRRFREAVQCRLRTPDSLQRGSFLSGGLDSSAIACTATEHTETPLDTFSVIFDNVPESDEREYIEAVLEHRPFDGHLVQGEEHLLFESIDEMFDRFDSPFVPNAHYLHWAVYRRASQENVSVILDGYGGDQAVGYGIGRFRELALRGHLQTLSQEVRAFAKHRDVPIRKVVFWDVVAPFAPAPIRRTWRALHNQTDSVSGRSPVIDDSFARDLDLTERIESLSQQAPTRRERDAQYQDLTSGNVPATFEVCDKAAATFGVEPRYPFFDRRLIEFSLAVPADHHLRKGWPRWLLRAAMEETLPEEVRWRATKGNLTHAFEYGLREDKSELSRSLFLSEHDTTYLNSTRLNEYYRRFQDGESVETLATLWRPALLRRWLNRIRS